MKALIFIGLFIFSLPSFSHSFSYRNEIKSLATDITYNIDSQELSNAQLADIKLLLLEAQNIMYYGGSDNTLDRCLDFSVPVYERFMTSSRALQRALSHCQEVEDVEVLELVYPILARTTTNSSAMDRATALASYPVRGKIEMIKFAYAKYSRTSSNSNAILRSIESVRYISAYSGLNCFKRFFPVYNQTMSPSSAMDRTIQSCRQIN